MDGKTKICGIIANPVEHSMSPLLQNHYAKRTGVNLAYVPYKVKEENLQSAVEGAYALNILGLNVTVPHKQTVMKYLKDIDETAADIGAVNTLVRMEGGYKGYNTDVPGLLRSIQEEGIVIKDRACILIGAGGAGKAAAYMMAKEGASVIYLLNRSKEKAMHLTEWVNRLAGRDVVRPLALEDHDKIPEGKYFAVQSTSVGMHPKVGAASIEDPSFYEKISEAVDVIYTPAKTKFMENVEAAGGRAVNGLNMLLYQGVISYELWNPGVKVDEDTIVEARTIIEERLAASRLASSRKANLILIGFMGAGKTCVGEVCEETRSYHGGYRLSDQGGSGNKHFRHLCRERGRNLPPHGDGASEKAGCREGEGRRTPHSLSRRRTSDAQREQGTAEKAGPRRLSARVCRHRIKKTEGRHLQAAASGRQCQAEGGGAD